jgi:hypothetical protein
MLGGVLETLMGMGLATSAGLNAYIPLLAVGLITRYTDVISLPGSWNWLSNGWVLAILGVLLVIEMVADKIPVVDHANDVIQTVVRPTSGGLVFGAATSTQSVTVDDPGQFFSSHQWVPIVAGIVMSFGVHSAKAAARPVVNATTFGAGAPVVSVIEDVFSVIMALVAILLPVLVLVLLVAMIGVFWWLIRRRRRRKQARQAAKYAQPGYPPR